MSQDAVRGVVSPASGMSERRVAQYLVGAMVAGFLALVVMVGMTLWLVGRTHDYQALINHTNQVQRQAAEFRVAFERSEAAQRGYLLTRERSYLDIYDRTRAPIPRIVEDIGRLTVDNPAQQDRVELLRKLLEAKFALNDRTQQLIRAGDQAGAMRTFQAGAADNFIGRIRNLAADIATEEGRLLNDRSALQNDNIRILVEVILIAGGLLVLLAGGSIFIVRRYAAALNRAHANLRKLNEGLEENVKDRVADLTRANQEIQRFAYIVSHDLRSPLVNVMGFTAELEVAMEPLKAMLAAAEEKAPEIVTPAAREAVEVDLPESIGFIRSSTRKMDSLINAILKLSREGRRTMTPERLDMDKLIGAVIDSVQHRATASGAVVEIEGDLPDIISDRLSVEQIFGNLVDNALKYQAPGRPGRVLIRGEATLVRAHFEVQDNGRGVDPKDHERIFDLFRRAGVQDKPGEGIGLAHVRALVHRLGGSIDCVSALDQGATFRISLPLVLAREEAWV